MNPIPFTGHVHEDHSLSGIAPDSVPPGPVTIFVIPTSATDEADSAWSTAIAREWSDDLADVQQDIYSMEDGCPIHEG